jgi:hypothetical protein
VKNKFFLGLVLTNILFGLFLGFFGINCVHEGGHYLVAYLSDAKITGAWCGYVDVSSIIQNPFQIHVGGEVSVTDPSVFNFHQTVGWFLMGGVATSLFAAYVVLQTNLLLKIGNDKRVFMVTSFMVGVIVSIIPSVTMGWYSDVYKFIVFLGVGQYQAQRLTELLGIASTVVYFIILTKIVFRYAFLLSKIVSPDKSGKMEKFMKKIPGLFR